MLKSKTKNKCLHVSTVESFAEHVLLLFLFFLITELNECTSNVHNCACSSSLIPVIGCTAVCNDVPGTYTCSCSAGYELGPDGFTCIGISLVLGCSLSPFGSLLIFLRRTCSRFLLAGNAEQWK